MIFADIFRLGWGYTALLVLYWLVVIIFLIATDREPSVTIAWILVMCLLPGIGWILYYFTGRNWEAITKKSKWFKARESIRVPFMEKIWAHYKQESTGFFDANPNKQIEMLIKTIWNQTKTAPLPARNIEIWTTGASYYPELLDDLRRAQESIHMQYFIWEEDQLTDEIVDILIDRISHGVEVRILNDFFGCLPYSKKGLKRIRNAGGVVLSDVTALNKLNYRNHRKITVVDGVVAHTGGFNIGKEYIDGGKHYSAWRDTGMRFRGPAVFKLQDLFCQRWFEVENESLWLPKYFPLDRIGEGDTFVQVAHQGVEDEWHASTDAHEIAISRANEYVWLQSPYYVPTENIAAALTNAAFAGVDVRVMITGIPDKKIAWDAAFTYFKPLLDAGAKVYLYEGGFFHAKSLVTDDVASAIGTMNLDFRSLYLHKEFMVWLYSKELALFNKQVFLNDQMKSRRLTLEDLEAIGPIQRFRNSAYRLMSRLL